MNWFKRSTYEVFVALLFVTLLGAVISTSLFAGIGNKEQTKQWFNKSGIYDQLVTNAINNAQDSSQSGADTASISLKDPAVQEIARSVYSPKFVQQRVETFLDSNYQWLQGKTETPKFKIDLTDNKQTFATTVGSNVQTYLSGLKTCTPEQLAQLQASSVSSPLTIACRPATIDPKTEATRITEQISNGPFIDNPVITADTVSSDYGIEGSRPYYQRYAVAPKLYRALQALPLILAVVSLILIMALFSLGATKRATARRIAFVSLLVGVSLIIIKFVADYILNKVQNHVFTNQNASELQAPVTSIVHSFERAVTQIDLYAGIVFILLGCVLLLVVGHINKNRSKARNHPSYPYTPPVATDQRTSESTANSAVDRMRPAQIPSAPLMSSKPNQQSNKTAPLVPSNTKKRRSKRLIQ